MTLVGDGVLVAIRLTPRAKADRLLAIGAAAEGKSVLKAAVTAPPEGGRANAALLQLLARAWRLPARELSIIRGTTSRNKVVHVAGDPRQLREKIGRDIAVLPSEPGD